MGSLNPFAKPKMPAPVVTATPTIEDPTIKTDLEAERKRRAAASGSTANIASSLVGATTDIQSSSRRSTLLGG